MNGLLNGARAIVADLVRKRLWPIAGLLLVALVALPLLLGASSSPPAPVPGDGVVAAMPPQTAPAADGQEAATTLPRERGARVRDPFFDPPAKESDDEGATKPSAGSGNAASSKPAAVETAAAKPSDTKPSAATDAKSSSPAAKQPATSAPAERPAAPTGTYHRTAARLAAGATTRPLARLTPIGNPARPAAVYLGVMKVGRPYAVFVLGRRTTSRGEATCAVATDCRIIGLRPGDTQTITVYAADGHLAQRYVVHVTSLKPIATSAANARAQRAHVHPAGRDAVHAISRDAAGAATLRRMGYRPTTGLLFSQAADGVEQATR